MTSPFMEAAQGFRGRTRPRPRNPSQVYVTGRRPPERTR